jgi:hypothetical protein
MKTVKKIAPHYLEKAAIEEFAVNLRDQGYQVEVEKNLGSFRADLIASRNGEKIVYEFKSGSWSRDKTEQAQRLRNYVVHEYGGKFELVWVNPYREVDLHIEGLEHLLAEAIHKDPGPLDELSTHTLVDEVDDIQVNSLDIGFEGISVEGEGTVHVELNYGSESDRESGLGASSFDSFPFKFAVRLNGELQPLDEPEVSIDVSNFYE